jgi:hypothetical protein
MKRAGGASMDESSRLVLCQACGDFKGTEHADGWDAPLCLDCQGKLSEGWLKAQKQRGLISLILVSASGASFTSPQVQRAPLLIALLVVLTLFIILWDNRTLKDIDQRYFIRRTY